LFEASVRGRACDHLGSLAPRIPTWLSCRSRRIGGTGHSAVFAAHELRCSFSLRADPGEQLHSASPSARIDSLVTAKFLVCLTKKCSKEGSRFGLKLTIQVLSVSAEYCFGSDPLVLQNLSKVNFIFAPN